MFICVYIFVCVDIADICPYPLDVYMGSWVYICEYCVHQSISVYMFISAYMFVSANIVDIRQYLTLSDLRVTMHHLQSQSHRAPSPCTVPDFQVMFIFVHM